MHNLIDRVRIINVAQPANFLPPNNNDFKSFEPNRLCLFLLFDEEMSYFLAEF